jgi:hypothetical protein
VQKWCKTGASCANAVQGKRFDAGMIAVFFQLFFIQVVVS